MLEGHKSCKRAIRKLLFSLFVHLQRAIINYPFGQEKNGKAHALAINFKLNFLDLLLNYSLACPITLVLPKILMGHRFQ